MDNQFAAELYDKMIQSYQNGEKKLFETHAKNLASLFTNSGELPFDKNSVEHYDLIQMMVGYKKWVTSGLTECPGKKQLLAAARSISHKDLPNPWDYRR